MGKLIWHDLARLVALTAIIYSCWGAAWSCFFRKFFWDMIGGTLGPHGIIPGPNAAPFVAIIVRVPIVQAIVIFNGMIGFAWEYPLPYLARLPISRSHLARAAWLTWSAFWASLLYQSVDSALYFLVAILMYIKAHRNGEVVPEPARPGRSATAV